MKMPTDKQERLKLFAGIALGVVVVIFVAINYGLRPLLKSKQETREKIVELKGQIEDAEKEIKQMSKDIEKNRQTILKIKSISEKYILHPEIVSYLLRATKILEPIAKQADVNIEIKELGPADLPAGKSAAPRTVRCYGARVVMDCGYNDLVRFIKLIEAANPYYSITGLTIMSQPDKSVKKHKVVMDIQWPSWVIVEMPAKFDAQLTKLSEEARLQKSAK